MIETLNDKQHKWIAEKIEAFRRKYSDEDYGNEEQSELMLEEINQIVIKTKHNETIKQMMLEVLIGYDRRWHQQKGANYGRYDYEPTGTDRTGNL